MKKHILILVAASIHFAAHSQPVNNDYSLQSFPIAKSDGQVTIAGALTTLAYRDYYGSNVKRESYINAHSKPEYLIYELFLDMKRNDINAIGKLYDTSFNRKSFEGTQMAAMLRNYTDIKFLSKFKSGDLLVVRYNFISSHDEYPYFAVVKENLGEYYLTMDLNISDPLNTIGSLSPYNLFDKKPEKINTGNMTPFYFISKNSKVYLTTELPSEDYSAIYLDLEFYKQTDAGADIEFLNKLQQAGQSGDTATMKKMIFSGEFNSYYFEPVRAIFGKYADISPLCAIKTHEGKVVYFKFSNNGESAHIASIILKEQHGQYFVSFNITDPDVNNILQNNYVREAIYDYLQHKS